MWQLLAIVGLMALSAPGAEPDAAVITDSGSTNRPGFRIVVEQSGTAELTSTPRKSRARDGHAKPVRKSLPGDVAKRFHADLDAAKPFGSLPVVHCMKSASFGSTMTIEFGGEQTPDLKCGDGGNGAMRDLIRDANEIVALVQAN